MDGDSHKQTTWRRDAARVATVALVVRLAYLLARVCGLGLEAPTVLAEVYLRDGYSLAAGYGYIEVDRGGPAAAQVARIRADVEQRGVALHPGQVAPLPERGWRPAMLHPPGMALLAAGLHGLSGKPVHHLLGLVGVLLDTLAALLLWWLVRALWSERLAMWSGLAYALFLPLAFGAAASRTPEGLSAFFVLATVCATLRGVRAPGRQAWLWYALAGVATGVGSLLRPDYLLLPLWSVPAVALIGRPWRHALGSMLLAQLVAMLVLLPWAARNHDLTGRWIFTSTSAGATLICGLGEFSNPWHIGYEDADRARMAKEHGIDSPWSSEADLYFRQVFWSAVREHPGAWALAVLRRLPLALASPHSVGYVNPAKTIDFAHDATSTGRDRYAAIAAHPGYVLQAYGDRLLTAGISLLCALASVLLLWKVPQRRAAVWFILSAHAYGVASHVAVHVEPRFLLPSCFGLLFALAWLLLTRAGRLAVVDVPPT